MHKIRLGVSRCLMGEPVRYDGGHKRFEYLTDKLANFVEVETFCPEVSIGMGVPRQPVRLVSQSTGNSQNSSEPASSQTQANYRVVGTKNANLDITEALTTYSEDICHSAISSLSGFIFQKGSPSCGMERVKVYDTNGNPLHKRGIGLFAQSVMQNHPLLPVEESGRLQNTALRDNFLTRVFAYADLKFHLIDRQCKFSDILDFYARYKYLVMAHSLEAYQNIGRLLSKNEPHRFEAQKNNFVTEFMRALTQLATRKTHTNVLMHLQGYLKNHLSKDHKAHLGSVINAYRLGELPLVVPVTLLEHLATELDLPYLKQQKYWRPYPGELRQAGWI